MAAHGAYDLDPIGGSGMALRTRSTFSPGRAINAYTLDPPCHCETTTPLDATLPPPVEYTPVARSKVLIQYRQSTRLLAFIDSLIGPCQDIDDTANLIPPLDDIDAASGVNLDVIGERVGQARVLLNGTTVTDTLYRLLIRARITRNQAHATGPELLAILSQVFAAEVRIDDYEAMAIAYAIGRTVTSDERALLNGGAGGTILARPMGVMVTQQFFTPGNFFGFTDTPGALCFGELNLAGPPGGPFSEIF